MDGLFAIRYGDTALDVQEGSRLTVEWMSVLFNEESLFAGSYSYPIVFPLTPLNKAAFANAHMPENRRARKKLPVLVQLYGQSWKRAVLAFDVTGDGYEGDLQIDSGTVADWMRERSLASVFTISNGGKFVRHIPVKVSSDPVGRVFSIMDSIANPGKYPWVFFPLRNDLRSGDAEDGEAVVPEGKFVNEWKDGFFTTLPDKLFSPFFYLTWVIGKVCDWLGFEARGSFLEHPEVRTWVIYNTGMIGSEEFGNASLELYPARHLPGMSVAAFMKALRNDLKVAIYFDSHTRIAHFELGDDVLGAPGGVDLSAKVEAGSLRIKRNGVDGYNLKVMVDDGDEMYMQSQYVRNYFAGTSEKPKPVDLQMGTTFMYRGPTEYHTPSALRMPWVKQVANIYDVKWQGMSSYNEDDTYGKNDFKLRLLAYKGTVPWPGVATDVPYATSDNLDVNGEPAYDYSLQPGGDHGWLTRFTLGWYEMLCATEQVDIMARLAVSEFMKLEPLRKFFFSGSSRARLAALPDRVTFEPMDKGRVVGCRILAYPHYNMAALDDGAFGGFEEGEVVVPDERIYAYLVYSESAPHWPNERYTINKNKEKRRVADITVKFFSDEDMLVPLAVENLPILIKRNCDNDPNNVHAEFSEEYTANGAVFVARPGTEVYHWKKPTLWNLWEKYEARTTFALEESPDGSYIVLYG